MSDLDRYLTDASEDRELRAKGRSRVLDAFVAAGSEAGYTFTTDEVAERFAGIRLVDLLERSNEA